VIKANGSLILKSSGLYEVALVGGIKFVLRVANPDKQAYIAGGGAGGNCIFSEHHLGLACGCVLGFTCGQTYTLMGFVEIASL
jgi:hypothetical protein